MRGGGGWDDSPQMFGGVVGQEVVKGCTGKFQPLHQFFYFDSVESLPKPFPLPADEYKPLGSRYDGQVGGTMALARCVAESSENPFGLETDCVGTTLTLAQPASVGGGDRAHGTRQADQDEDVRGGCRRTGLRTAQEPRTHGCGHRRRRGAS